ATNYTLPDNFWCSVHGFDLDGNILVVSGAPNTGIDGYRRISRESLAVTSGAQRRLTELSYNGDGRWYAGMTTLPSGYVAIWGGTLWTTDDQRTLFYYPMTFITPLDGRVLMWANNVGSILIPDGPNAGAVLAMLPPLPDPLLRTEFPYTASVQMLPIGPEDGYASMTFLIAGGTTYDAGRDTPAHPNVYSLTVTRDHATRAYRFSEWTVEPIAASLRAAPLSKVMGYITPLPNGKLIFSGGGQSGTAGDGRGRRPIFDAYLYTPWAPVGARFSLLGNSSIARMYHSVVGLGASGRLLVTGTTDSRWLKGGMRVEFMTPPDLMQELRVEVAFPAEARHGALVLINYSCPNATACASAPAITGAMLMAPASATHDMHAVQRSVRLPLVWARRDQRAVAVRLPPNSFVAVAGYYKLFLLAGERYTNAAWVRILPPAGFSPPTAAAPPPRLGVTGAAGLPRGPVLLQNGKSTTAALAAGGACGGSRLNAQVVLEPTNRTEARQYWTYDATTQLLRSEYCGLCVATALPARAKSQLELWRAFALSLAPCDAAAALQRWVWREEWVHWPAPEPGASGGAAARRVLLRSPVSRVTSPPMCLGQAPGGDSQLGLVNCSPGDATQAFQFDQARGTLVSAASGLALAAASADDGAPLGLATPDGSNLQRWEADASPLMALRSVARPDGCVEVRGGADAVGTPVGLRRCRPPEDVNRLQQVWQPVPIPEPPSTDPVALQLVQGAQASPLCATVPAGSTDVVLWSCAPGARNQTFSLNRQLGLIAPLVPRRALDLKPGRDGGAPRVAVRPAGSTPGVTVFWLFDPLGPTIRPKTSPGQCWRAAGAAFGASIDIADCGPMSSPDGRRGQLWRTVANPLAS
ncbi:hypothetical protein Rsub_13387, partial [Raphidocelis subcapitata]